MHTIKDLAKKTLKKAYIASRILLNRPVRTRDDLPIFLNMLGLKGHGAEIGVDLGVYSEHILKHSRLSRLYSIDPWFEFDMETYKDCTNTSQAKYDIRFGAVSDKLKKYGNRSRIMRMTSEEASRAFGEGTLDFIYIDANHSYKSSFADFGLWWPKLKNGGVLAFHDYVNAEINSTVYEVKRSADEFFQNKPCRLFVTPEEWPTGYLIKESSQMLKFLRLG